MGLAAQSSAASALVSKAERDTMSRSRLRSDPRLWLQIRRRTIITKKASIKEAFFVIGAGNGIRTHDINLGKVALYP